MTVSPPMSRRQNSQAQVPPSPRSDFYPAARSSKSFVHAPHTPNYSSSTSSRTRDRSLNGSRKRTRPGPSPVQATPWSMSNSNWTNVSTTSSIARSDAMSPQPFVNTTYILKGGMETPSQELDIDTADNEFRRCWDSDSIEPNNAGPLVLPSTATPREGWGKLVFSLAGTVAGKMWNFCSVPFNGFYAGGGKGVPVSLENHESLREASTMWDNAGREQTQSEESLFNRTMTPIPGQYPTDDPFTMHDTTPPRPAKRLHTDRGASWMLVPLRGEGDCESISRCNSPARLTTRKTPSQSYIPRPSLPSEHSASKQSLARRSLIPVSRRSSLSANPSPSIRPASRQSSYFVSHDVSPRARAYTPMNPFSQYEDRPATPIHATNQENATPLSPEVEEYAARMRYEEEVADESMRNMHQRLQDLIREGQKALKSNYNNDPADTHMTSYDEGFEDGVY